MFRECLKQTNSNTVGYLFSLPLLSQFLRFVFGTHLKAFGLLDKIFTAFVIVADTTIILLLFFCWITRMRG